jgi:hypothetical protein
MASSTLDPTSDSLDPTLPAPTSKAAELLSPLSNNASDDMMRLLAGVLGLALLGVPATLVQFFERNEKAFRPWVSLQSVTLPITAATTLTLSLPGLWILLSVFNEQLEPRAVVNAVARTYLRGGLLCLGFTPTLLLFAASGGSSDGVLVSSTFTYFFAGTIALVSLARDLGAMLRQRTPLTLGILLGWALFTMVLGLYLFVRMQHFILF